MLTRSSYFCNRPHVVESVMTNGKGRRRMERVDRLAAKSRSDERLFAAPNLDPHLPSSFSLFVVERIWASRASLQWRCRASCMGGLFIVSWPMWRKLWPRL